jgi:hypothetical protein
MCYVRRLFSRRNEGAGVCRSLEAQITLWWGGGVGEASHIKRPIPRGKHVETSLMVNNTNSQRSWYNFLGKLAIKNGDEDRKRKFVRLNPPIGKGNLVSGNCPLPNFDEVDKMAALASYTNELYIPHNSEQLRAVADSLVASLFYFEEAHHVSQKNGDWLVEGVFERPLHLSTPVLVNRF